MKKVALFVLVFIVGVSGLSMAKDPGFGGGGAKAGREGMGLPGGKWWKMPLVADKLALTPEEKEKLDASYLQYRRRSIDLRHQVEKERLEMEQLLDSTSFNAAAALERFKKLKEAQTNLDIERFKFLAQVRELLGSERYQKLKSEVRKHRMKRKKKKQSAPE